MNRRTQRWLARALVLSASLLGGGCMIPDHYKPAGFSSTYHRRLWSKPAVVELLPEETPADSPRP